jgi:hypothetical protein
MGTCHPHFKKRKIALGFIIMGQACCRLSFYNASSEIFYLIVFFFNVRLSLRDKKNVFVKKNK